MATQLHQVLTFTAVAAGGQATQAHNINWNGRTVIPDIILPFYTNGAFTVISCDEDSLTIQNDGGEAATFQFWLFDLHSIERAFGKVPGTQAEMFLSPLPFVVGGGGSGGGGGGVQSFRYIVTGAEASLSDFFVPLPAARSSDVYQVNGNCAGVAVIVALDFPDLVAGDRTTTQFRLVASAPMQAGDQIDFVVA